MVSGERGKDFRLRDRFGEINYAGKARNFFRNSVIETVVLRVTGWFVGSSFLLCRCCSAVFRL